MGGPSLQDLISRAIDDIDDGGKDDDIVDDERDSPPPKTWNAVQRGGGVEAPYTPLPKTYDGIPTLDARPTP